MLLYAPRRTIDDMTKGEAQDQVAAQSMFKNSASCEWIAGRLRDDFGEIKQESDEHLSPDHLF